MVRSERRRENKKQKNRNRMFYSVVLLQDCLRSDIECSEIIGLDFRNSLLMQPLTVYDKVRKGIYFEGV